MTLLENSRVIFKYLTIRENNFLIIITIIDNLLVWPILKARLGWNMLAYLTYYMYKLPDELPIILLLANIFYMNIFNIKNYKTPRECPSKTFSLFSSLIIELFAFKKILFRSFFTEFYILLSIVLYYL